MNYYWHRKRRKPITVESEESLPKGNWVTAIEAARIMGYSRQTIYNRFYTGKCDGYSINGGPLIVNLDEIK